MVSTKTATDVIPAALADLLETKALMDVATIGPHGAPQVNPVWFDWDGTYVYFSQTTTRQKYRNVQRDPRIALSIVDPENPYRYLEIRGKVVRIDPDPDKAFIDKMAQKYLGVEKYPWNRPDDERVVVVVEPEHTTHMG
ncbi:MAG TPA: PPOX class F420-dependent oxidoreductase [Thermomicrobiales bacterium]|nr:PPOX class F420-dependent oxidoreductase [Thermomicrobiales bacterium]